MQGRGGDTFLLFPLCCLFYRDLLNVILKQGLKTFAREPKTSRQWIIQKNYVDALDHKRLDIRYISVLEPKFLILTPKRPIL